jgi:hypothetical protein
MGLALYEVVIVVEDAFGIPIPDQDMDQIPTPAALVDYLLEKLAPASEQDAHSTHRAFVRLCEAIGYVLGPPRLEILPSTSWDSLLPRSPARVDEIWYKMEDFLGTPLHRGHGGAATVGATAIHLANRGTPGPAEAARLRTREEIAETVRRLIRERLEVKEFTDQTPFSAMGLD